MRLAISEIFKRVNALPKEQRVDTLRELGNQLTGIKVILQHNFNPKFKYLLPEGEILFKKNLVEIGQEGALYTGIRRLYLFVEYDGQPAADLKQTKREQQFVTLLEGLHPSDADLLIALKDKKLATCYKNITEAVATEAFPDIML